jgi:hypothetical protein
MSASTISTPASTPMLLSSKHCRAICEEIGERLALVLKPDTSTLPPRLQDLLDRLALVDHDAPSIVPDAEDMVMPETASTSHS